MSSTPKEFSPPDDTAGRLGLGLSLAIAAHALLVLALSWGVSWNSKAPDGIQAELWSAVPQIAAPPAPNIEPVKPTLPKPSKAAAKAEPSRPPQQTAPARPAEQGLRDAQIAIEKARRELDARAEKKRKEAELDRLKLREKEREKEKEKEKEKKVEAEKQKAEERQQKEQTEKIEANRLKYLKRLQEQAVAGAEPSTGLAARTSGGISASYAGRVRAAVIPNIINIHSFVGNPTAEVKVTLAPDGRILSQNITKPSGISDWDEAVLRAIERTKVLPRQDDGSVPPYLILTLSPKNP